MSMYRLYYYSLAMAGRKCNFYNLMYPTNLFYMSLLFFLPCACSTPLISILQIKHIIIILMRKLTWYNLAFWICHHSWEVDTAVYLCFKFWIVVKLVADSGSFLNSWLSAMWLIVWSLCTNWIKYRSSFLFLSFFSGHMTCFNGLFQCVTAGVGVVYHPGLRFPSCSAIC